MERTPRTTSAVAAITTLVGAEALAVVALVRLGRVPGFTPPTHDVGAWVRTAPTEVLVAVTGRFVALTLATWILVSTLLSLARRLLPLIHAVSALDLATPRQVRRLLDRMVVIGLGASLTIGSVRPAGATTPSSRVGGARPAIASVDQPVVRAPIAPIAPSRSVPARSQAPPARAAPRSHASPSSSTNVVVAAGDNLWLIAGRAVGSDRPSAIAPYWRALIAANLASLRSGNPNLIFPGERIVLPPRSPAG
jgi:nucleoid-associated protein YgaU